MKKYAFGVDIKEKTTFLGLLDTSGELLETWEIPTRTESGGKYILEDIANSLSIKLMERGLFRSDIKGIGMGVPGAVREDGMVFRCDLLGWDGFNVENRMYSATGFSVKVRNRIHMAALGEFWKGSGRGCKSMVLVEVEAGIRCGIVLNGQLFAGFHGAMGELNDYPVGENLSAANLFGTTNSRNKTCFESLSCLESVLGKMLAQISCVLDPERIVLATDSIKWTGDGFLEAVQKEFQRNASPIAGEIMFCLAKLGRSAGIYGSVKALLDR